MRHEKTIILTTPPHATRTLTHVPTRWTSKVPVFNRLQLRVGNVVVEDIMGLSSVERCLSNFDSVCKKYANSNQTGDFRATPNVNGVLDAPATLKEIRYVRTRTVNLATRIVYFLHTRLKYRISRT